MYVRWYKGSWIHQNKGPCVFVHFPLDKFNSSSVNKRQKLAQDFLNSIDQTGELLAMFEDDEIDDVKLERMEVILVPSPTCN